MRVVMVDDSPGDRAMCRVLLEETRGSDLEFFGEASAAEGLAACAALSPDCVLLDYKLPDMTGLEFLAHLCLNDPADAPSFAVVMRAWREEYLRLIPHRRCRGRGPRSA